MPDLTPDTSGPALPPQVRGRLASSRAELLRLADALVQRPHPEERAILAGALLSTAGYLLRRSRAVASADLDPAYPECVLGDLSRDDLQAWLTVASVAGLRRTLQKAADSAFEAALADDADERERLREIALEGLAERERLASALHALDRWELLHGPLDDRARRRRDALALEASRIDDSLRASSVALTHLNDERRIERDSLEDSFLASSWWYARHADRDDLAALTLGVSPNLTSSPRVSAAIRIVNDPPKRHLSAEELWAFECGFLDGDQQAWLQRHTASCGECRRAMQALSEGEEVIIQEALGQPARIASKSEHELIFDHPQLRVLASRVAKKSRILLEEKHPGVIAAVHPVGGIKPRKLRQGFELALPLRNKEPLRLRLVLVSGEELLIPLPTA
jgi:hypothetical protein